MMDTKHNSGPAWTAESFAAVFGPALEPAWAAIDRRAKAAGEAIYEEILNAVETHLRSNVEWNIGGQLERARCIELENIKLRDAVEALLALVRQYRDDLRHPPAPDSIERRLAAIAAVLAKVEKRS